MGYVSDCLSGLPRHDGIRWGPGRVGAQSGLGPGPGWGPYGSIWALMFFVKIADVSNKNRIFCGP